MTKTEERRAWALRIAIDLHEQGQTRTPGPSSTTASVLVSAASIDAFLRDGIFPRRSS